MKGEKALGLRFVKHCKEPSIKQIQSMSFNLSKILNDYIQVCIESITYHEAHYIEYSINSPKFSYSTKDWKELQDKYIELVRSKDE